MTKHTYSHRLFLPVLLALAVMFSWSSVANAGTLPRLANTMYEDLQNQLCEHLGMPGVGSGYRLIITTPVNLTYLEVASPLARQLAEELATNFTKAGYRVQEIRRANTVLFRQNQGELLLTRRVHLVNERNIRGSLVMAGTYVATSKHIRFSIKIMDAASNDTLAMSSVSLPVGQEAMELMDDGTGQPVMGMAPSVKTTFTPRSWTLR